MSDNAGSYESRIEYWENMSNKIDLSMPESLEYYNFKYEQAKETHTGIKNGTIERSHSFSLTYAKKALNEAEKMYNLAVKLWGE